MTFDTKYNDKDRVYTKKDSLPEKSFASRESLLTVLFENVHIRTLHHCFSALLLGIVLTTSIKDHMEGKELVSGFRLIFLGFGRLHIALLIWMVQFCITCATYQCFKVWAHCRIKCGPKEGGWKKCVDYFGILLVAAYYLASFKFWGMIVWKFNLPGASASVVLVEESRMLMKVHAFIRGNTPKVLAHKQKSDEELVLPSFKDFVYFFFAPTLIYSDKYPRTKTTNWSAVLNYSLEIIAIVLLYAFMMERFLIPVFEDFGIRKRTYTEVFITVLETSLSGTLFLLATFYLVLHVVQNLFAEILRFGDRMFYKDWWTATDFATFHRKWNVVVHDWLYTYLYKDFYEIVVPGNTFVSKYLTFFISAIVHEWILMHMFGYFLPALFLLFFCAGTLLTHVKVPNNALFNTLYLLSIGYSTGIMITGYIMEYFARVNGIPPSKQELDFYIPRIITCDCYE